MERCIGFEPIPLLWKRSMLPLTLIPLKTFYDAFTAGAAAGAAGNAATTVASNASSAAASDASFAATSAAIAAGSLPLAAIKAFTSVVNFASESVNAIKISLSSITNSCEAQYSKSSITNSCEAQYSKFFILFLMLSLSSRIKMVAEIGFEPMMGLHPPVYETGDVGLAGPLGDRKLVLHRGLEPR